jgi:DNA-binding beta-propeller fold protein YncE
MPMNYTHLAILAGLIALNAAFVRPAIAVSASALPLVLEHSIDLPSGIGGKFDHLAIDTKRNRAVLTAEKDHALIVVDLTSDRVATVIRNIGLPHGVLYRPDVDRFYVSDGTGRLLILDAANYRVVKRIPLRVDADSLTFDPSTKLLYVDNGGKDAGSETSFVSIVDTGAEQKAGDIAVSGNRLEALVGDLYRPRLYVNDTAKNAVVVLDRWTREEIARWPVTLGRENVAIALDEQHERLFVACHTGGIVVFNSTTGRELRSFPTIARVDDLVFDSARKELLASGDGATMVYSVDDRGATTVVPHRIETGSGAITGRFDSPNNRYVTVVPKSANSPAKLLVFRTAQTWVNPNPSAPFAYAPDAPRAEDIVLSTLSQYPFLRKLGLHGVRPGQSVSVLLANGNATRRGIQTTPGDFAAVAGSKQYAPFIADGSFYNIKLPMYDATGRRIGLLVMEIPSSAASNYTEAIAKADRVRATVSAQIPNLRSLFAGVTASSQRVQ